MSRQSLQRMLPEDGTPGETRYFASGATLSAPSFGGAAALFDAAASSAAGSVLFAPAGAPTILVAPPFAIESTADFNEIYARPLRELLDRPRAVAVFLLRLGGFSVGFFRGSELVDSKTDQRFVKNRHRKGGQSQRRFERIREKQIDELFGKACETAREKLAPYEREIEHVFLGGDRHTLQAFRKQCDYFDRFGGRLMARTLPVAGDPRRASLEAMPREIWSSDVWIADEADTVSAEAG